MNLKIDMEFEVDTDDEDKVFNLLEERFAIENTTAENQFWENLEIVK